MRVTSDGFYTYVTMDADGNGLADMQIALTGAIGLQASDFVL